MTKQAASLNFVKALHQRREEARKRDLRPAWWTNALGAEAGLAGSIPLARSADKTPAPSTTNVAELDDILGQTGMDLRLVHKEEGRLAKHPMVRKLLRDYFYQPNNVDSIEAGQHGVIGKIGGDPEKWSLPLFGRELGHAQIEHGLAGPLAKVLQHVRRPAGLAGLTGNLFESFRALDDKDRSLDARKSMLNRASIFSGIGSVPMLANEYQASRKGLDVLKNLALENKGEVLSAARKIYPKSFGSYAMMATAPVLAPQVAKLLLPKNTH